MQVWAVLQINIIVHVYITTHHRLLENLDLNVCILFIVINTMSAMPRNSDTKIGVHIKHSYIPLELSPYF